MTMPPPPIARFSAPRRPLVLLLLACVGAGVLAACSSPASRSPYARHEPDRRNPLLAQELTLRAADLIPERPGDAEALLRDALAVDLFHGPAHNNLGIIHLQRGELYDAAREFEWARKLMPHAPEPRVNLAIALERAGQTGDAADAYRAALDLAPEHMPAVQGLTRLELRAGRPSDQTSERLALIALRGTDERWRDWARLRQHEPAP